MTKSFSHSEAHVSQVLQVVQPYKHDTYRLTFVHRSWCVHHRADIILANESKLIQLGVIIWISSCLRSHSFFVGDMRTLQANWTL